MKARITDRKAVINQNACQFHCAGKRLPMAPKPPNEEAPLHKDILELRHIIFQRLDAHSDTGGE